MMSVQLRVPSSEVRQEREEVLAYYSLVKRKEKKYCEDRATSTDFRENIDLDSVDENEFEITSPIPTEWYQYIDWDYLDDLFTQNHRIENEYDIRRTISYFKEEKEKRDDDFKCFVEIGPIATCEFALKRGYSIILDR